MLSCIENVKSELRQELSDQCTGVWVFVSDPGKQLGREEGRGKKEVKKKEGGYKRKVIEVREFHLQQ